MAIRHVGWTTDDPLQSIHDSAEGWHAAEEHLSSVLQRLLQSRAGQQGDQPPLRFEILGHADFVPAATTDAPLRAPQTAPADTNFVTPHVDSWSFAPPGSGAERGRASQEATGPQAEAANVALPVLAGAGRSFDHLAEGAAAQHGHPGQTADAPQAIVIQTNVVLTDVPLGGAGVALGDTFRLHSLPGSNYTIYLDFDGHTTTGSAWNTFWGTSSFYSPAFSLDGSEAFSATELLRIQQIWQRISEYFAPFNINVTTEDPGLGALTFSGAGDATLGKRVVITDEEGKNFGGMGYVGSWNWAADTPVFAYANRLFDNVKYIADAVAHEVGHTLGLEHDGRTVNGTVGEYYYGHGAGVTDWAPVMGVGYNANLVQWSNGSYNGATNAEDDLTIITTRNNGVSFRTDDWGNTFGTAGSLGGTASGGMMSVQAYGVISGSGSRNDVDMFWFDVAAGGSINLNVSSASRAFVGGSFTPTFASSSSTMLDLGLTLFDSLFRPVLSWNDVSRLDGAISATGLAGGTYYLSLDGVGWGDPSAAAPTGYTDYGSLGQYMITGTYTAGAVPKAQISVDRTAITTVEGGTQAFTISATGATGAVPVTITVGNPGEGRVSQPEIVLNAANNWTATVQLTGIDDRARDGDTTYSVLVSTPGSEATTIAVTTRDNDLLPATTGTAFGSYMMQPAVQNATLNALSRDDGTALSLREGLTPRGASLEWRWQFNGLAPGDKLLQARAWSDTETFRLEVSTDNAATWRALAGAPAASTSWDGAWLATGVGSSLLVRLIDNAVSGDNRRDTFFVDLLTLADRPSDWMMS